MFCEQRSGHLGFYQRMHEIAHQKAIQNDSIYFPVDGENTFVSPSRHSTQNQASKSLISVHNESNSNQSLTNTKYLGHYQAPSTQAIVTITSTDLTNLVLNLIDRQISTICYTEFRSNLSAAL